MAGFGRNHKTFLANFYDPLGIFPSGKKKNSDSPKPMDAPQVSTDSESEDPERLKRIGRASLVTSSSRGVLTTGDTSSRKLFGV